LLSLVIAVFAEPLVHRVIAPGFPPDQLAWLVRVMRLDLIAIVIFSISGLIMAGLQANQHFLPPAPMFYNLGRSLGSPSGAETNLTIGSVTLPAYGGIYGLVCGVLIRAALHLAIQIPGLIAYRFHWTPAIDLRNPGVVKVLHLLGPRILTMFFLQVFFVARDNIASRYGEGAITALNYGWFIMQVPDLIGTAIAIALPTISEQFARRGRRHHRDTVSTPCGSSWR
jgi:putative peptidoglycan lipid II flippase